MADNPVLIGIRFALYADLMLVAGLAAFPLYALTAGERRGPQPMAAIWRMERWLCFTGLLVSTLGMAVLAASIFHFGQHSIGEAKAAMAAAGIPVRLT